MTPQLIWWRRPWGRGEWRREDNILLYQELCWGGLIEMVKYISTVFQVTPR